MAPFAYAAFDEYVLNGTTLSAHETRIVAKLLKGRTPSWDDFTYFGEPTFDESGNLNKTLTSRRRELSEKIGAPIEVEGDASPAGGLPRAGLTGGFRAEKHTTSTLGRECPS